MKKIIIMSAAVTASLLAGETMMAAVFGFVMVTGHLAGCFLSEPTRPGHRMPRFGHYR